MTMCSDIVIREINKVFSDLLGP